VSEPRGDSPDRPPAGEARVPGGSDDYLPIAFAGDDPRDIDWPVILEHCEYENVWVGGMELQPDGTWHMWNEDLVPGPKAG
jgi:hypothetical protein